MSRAAFEAIMFQSNSSLGRNISSAISKAFQYRNALDYSKVPEGKRAEYRQNKMLEYCTNKLTPELQKIVKNDCGIIVEKVLLGSNPNGMFACTFNYNQELVATLASRMSGTWHRESLETASDKLAAALRANIDLKDSKANMNKNIIKMDLYFDYLLCFCMYDFAPQSLVDELTPDEITGIILHEIGHAYTFAEHAIDSCYKMRSIQDKFEAVGKLLHENKDYKETSAVIKNKIIPIIKSISDVPDSLVDVSYKISDKIDKCLEYGEEKSILKEVLFGYIFLLVKIFNILLMVMYNIFVIIIKGHLVRFIMNYLAWFKLKLKIYSIAINETVEYTKGSEFAVLKPSGSVDNSDVALSMFNIRALESRADEFAVRHGYGSYVQSGLVKLQTLMEYFSLNNAYFVPTSMVIGMREGLRGNVFIVNIIKFAILVINVLGFKGNNVLSGLDVVTRMLDGYDSEVNRIKRAMVDLRAVFKENLDPKSMAYWILEYERMMTTLEESKSKSRNWKISEFMKNVNGCLLMDPFSFKNELKKYDRFLTQINEMINNELYFNAAKFRQLASLK